MKIEKVSLPKLEANKGQLLGVPKNPRKWAKTDIDALIESIEETPRLLECRPLLVVQKGKKFIVVGGNMRFEAARKMKYEEVPCIILDEVDTQSVKEIVIKDNATFGAWDVEALANDWDDLPLEDWGVDFPDSDIAGKQMNNVEVDMDGWSEDMAMRFKFENKEEASIVRSYFVDKNPHDELLRLVGYGE